MITKKLGLLPRLIIAIVAGIILGTITRSAHLPVPVQFLATFNGFFGNFLSFIIPLIIIGFVIPGIADLGSEAGKLLAVTAGIAYASTLLAGTLAFVTDSLTFPFFLTAHTDIFSHANPEDALLPALIRIDMPPIMGVMTALILSFVLGIGIAVTRSETLKNIAREFQDIIKKVIESIIIPLLPVHILGVFTNMTHAGQVGLILQVFIKVFAIVIALHILMILLQYTVACAIAKRNPFTSIKKMIPAYVTALGTQSSAATIPVTLASAKKTGIREKIADFVIPLCATIHLAGSTITLTSCSMAILILNGQTANAAVMLPFIAILGVAMVAAPGIPGGAVMAALGFVQSLLGFNDTMSSLLIALYIAQDSFGTACNVTGDGAIAILVDALAADDSK
ncbi:MAG: dicarboxylate/amino acid:cation symporter [Treponema sp.]